jgi:hypothetical protein
MIPLGAGGRSRLLPVSVPMRYFGAAVAFQVLAWALAAASPDGITGWRGGLGPALAALHLATLGVLAMTAAGATLQMLPVATRQPVRSVAAARALWWLLTPGVLVFALGAAAYAPRAMAAGAAAVLAALALYAWLLFSNLRGAKGMPAIRAYGWAALACLAGTLVVAAALVLHYALGLALDRASFALAHAVLATYGFMGFLALGLSCFLLPMFALAPPPSERLAGGTLVLAVLAILLFHAGSFLNQALLVATAAALGLAAATSHVLMMERALARRLRPPLGPAFLLVRVSWGCLIASLGVGAGLSLEILPGTAEALFVVLLVPGWLLTFLAAVLQRIVPFLASVHAGAQGRGPGLVSAMTPERVLAAHRWLHLAALAILAAGAAAGLDWLARAGAAAFLAAALLFAAFFTAVLLRLRGSRTNGRSDVLQPTN